MDTDRPKFGHWIKSRHELNLYNSIDNCISKHYTDSMPKIKRIPKVPFSVRLPSSTIYQINDMIEDYGGQANVIQIAIDRLYREHRKTRELPKEARYNGLHLMVKTHQANGVEYTCPFCSFRMFVPSDSSRSIIIDPGDPDAGPHGFADAAGVYEVENTNEGN